MDLKLLWLVVYGFNLLICWHCWNIGHIGRIYQNIGPYSKEDELKNIGQHREYRDTGRAFKVSYCCPLLIVFFDDKIIRKLTKYFLDSKLHQRNCSHNLSTLMSMRHMRISLSQSEQQEVGGVWPEAWGKPIPILTLFVMNIRENRALTTMSTVAALCLPQPC